MVMVLLVVVYVSAGILTVREAVAGFSNEGVLTVTVLFAAAAGIHKTGALTKLFGRILGKPRSMQSAQMRLMIPVAFVSAFLNNTPIVAM
jgi:Na+/H+ antiporter NhaD/arsenite permease-like protein